MSGPEKRELIDQWQRWIDNELLWQIQYMIIDRRIFKALNDSLLRFEGQYEGAEITKWIARCYIANITLAIRRFVDKGNSVISMYRLLDEISKELPSLGPELFRDFATWPIEVREGKLLQDAIIKDMKDLGSHTIKIKYLTDKHVAHTDAKTDPLELPQVQDLDKAIEFLHWVYRKYAYLLAGYSWQPTDPPNENDIAPPGDDDYTAQFSKMWVSIQ
ncbi:hypothetical protein P12x_002475 [Tundrisphaera lichenicola]|uniref:AbiU2 domain-containing protein n=1 Tax=Tundrisphaera lichenicola TaxID=2029860 RepID=UPI003EB9F4C3